MILSLVAMASLGNPVENLTILGWLAFVHNCFNALQDVAVDALAVDLLPPEERGRVTGLMYGSKYLGTAIGGAGLSIVLGREGLTAAFIGMIMVVLVLTLLPLLTIERPGQRILPWFDRSEKAGQAKSPVQVSQTSFLRIFTKLIDAFANRGAAMTALLMLLAYAASGVLSPIGISLFTVNLGWSEEKYGMITGGAAVFAGLTGAIAGGFLADLFGPRRVAAVATVGFGGLLMGFGISDGLWSNNIFSTGYLVTESFLQGVFTTSLFAICLGVSRPVVAATQFTAFMALLNLSTTWSSSISGFVENQFGVAGAFILAGLLQASLILILPLTMTRNSNEPDLKA